MDEKFNFLTLPNNSGSDTATAMAMMNNNPWMYLVMLALFGGGNFGMNRGGVNTALDIETQNKLNALSNQINSNNNNEWAREAIQGNSFAISQLAQNLNVDANALREAVGTVKDAVFNLGAQNGMGFAGVTNAINLGNLNIIQQLKDCCCGMQKQVLEQGYQSRIETIQQTNDLQNSIRLENGLTRTEVAAFRQAWENARYQDVVAEKTRLQTELDLLKQSQGTAAAINGAVAPLAQQVQAMQYQMQTFIKTYGGKTVPADAAS
jgi:hypothetical protein